MTSKRKNLVSLCFVLANDLGMNFTRAPSTYLCTTYTTSLVIFLVEFLDMVVRGQFAELKLDDVQQDTERWEDDGW